MIEPNELPSGDAVRRHSLHGGKAADDSEVRAANFRYEQDHARMEYLARQRERYNKEWQQRFGGTSLAGQPKFIPLDDKGKVDERGIELLARYDEERVNKARRQNLIDGVDSYLKRQNTDKENPKWHEQKYPTEFKTTQQAAEEARATSSHAGKNFLKVSEVNLQVSFRQLPELITAV